MTCNDCIHFHYEWDHEHGLLYEDFFCKKHHEVRRMEGLDGTDFLPGEECDDYEFAYRPTREQWLEDEGDRKYHELKDEGLI